jgi:hypothetical protein
MVITVEASVYDSELPSVSIDTKMRFRAGVKLQAGELASWRDSAGQTIIINFR